MPLATDAAKKTVTGLDDDVAIETVVDELKRDHHSDALLARAMVEIAVKLCRELGDDGHARGGSIASRMLVGRFRGRETTMKRITFTFEGAGDWDTFEDYVLSACPSDRYDVDHRSVEEGRLTFFGRETETLRRWLSDPAGVGGFRVRDVVEDELSKAEWTQIKAAIGSTLEEPSRDVVALVRQLSDNDARQRSAAACALGELGTAAIAAVSNLCAATTDDERIVRCSAANAIAKMGPEARSAVPALLKLLSDGRNYNEFTHASDALERLRVDPLAVLPHLRRHLKHTDARIRAQAALELADKGEAAKEAIPEVVALLRDPEAEVRHYAAWALEEFGPLAAAAVTALRAALDDEDESVREMAKRALDAMDS